MTSMILRPTRNSLFNEIDRFFGEPFSLTRFRSDVPGDFSPRVDIRDTSDHILLIFELPGLKKDEINVTVKEGVLTVTGSREAKNEEKDNGYVRREIRSGSFSRSFTLPESVNTEKIGADYKNGLLMVRLDKLEEVKPKEVEVKVR